MKRLIMVSFAAAFFLALNLPSMAVAQSVDFPVEHRRLLQNHRGTLSITADRIEYKTDHQNESRSWRYQDIQQIRIESPVMIEITTYEDQAQMLGHDRVFTFKLLEGKITPEISALLMARAVRPVATSVMPVAEGMPKFETPVKHLHPLGGCQGTLRIYSDRVTYESADEPKHSRYWRYQDLQRFSHPARYRCSITTFEDKFGGPTGVYDFQLRADLPASAYDYVWVRVNPVELYPYPKAASRDALAANPQVAATAPQPSPIRERQDESKIQTIKVVLDDQGYQPASIELKQGLPARIEFVRRTEGGCGKEILIPEYGIKRELPVNEPVMIEFTPVRSGEYAFTCGMKMLHGKIVVREQPGTPAVVDEMQPREEAPDRKARPSVPRPTVQTAKVVVTAEGYKPDSLRLRRGVPARVTFVRQVEATCGTEIVLPEHGIKRALPLNRPVVVSFVPDKSGEFSFTCGMGMLRGKLIVEEK